MTQNIQASAKEPDGTILVLGGSDPNDFMNNAIGMIGEDGAYELRARFINLVPVSGTGQMQQAVQNVQRGFEGAQRDDYAPRQGAGSPPGGATYCPTHQQQAVWKDGGVSQRTGNPYKGFWKCPVTDQSISNFNGVGLKPACPQK